MSEYPPIKTRIAGISFENRDGTLRQAYASLARKGDRLLLRREPANPYDPDALAVDWCLPDGSLGQLGYVPRPLAMLLSPLIDNGARMSANVVRTGNAGQGLGLVGIRMAIVIEPSSLPAGRFGGLEPAIARALAAPEPTGPNDLAPALGGRGGPEANRSA